MELLELIKGSQTTEAEVFYYHRPNQPTIIHSHKHTSPYSVTSLCLSSLHNTRACYVDLARSLGNELTLLLTSLMTLKLRPWPAMAMGFRCRGCMPGTWAVIWCCNRLRGTARIAISTWNRGTTTQWRYCPFSPINWASIIAPRRRWRTGSRKRAWSRRISSTRQWADATNSLNSRVLTTYIGAYRNTCFF